MSRNTKNPRCIFYQTPFTTPNQVSPDHIQETFNKKNLQFKQSLYLLSLYYVSSLMLVYVKNPNMNLSLILSKNEKVRLMLIDIKFSGDSLSKDPTIYFIHKQ